MESTSLAQQLEGFGLNPTEAAIYIHLVSKHPQTMLEIARDLDLPRTSVYDNALKLADKGLVQKIVTAKSQKLKAYPPSILQSVIDKEKSHLDDLQEKLHNLEGALASTLAVPTATEVRYYYGAKGLQQMLWNSLRAKTGLIGYSQFGRVEVVGEKFIERHHSEAVKRGITDRVITNPKAEMLKYLTQKPDKSRRAQYQETRVMDSDRLYVSGDTTIFNDTFAIAYWKQGEVVGVEIDNPEFVKNQRSIFEEMWKLAEPLEAYLAKQ